MDGINVTFRQSPRENILSTLGGSLYTTIGWEDFFSVPVAGGEFGARDTDHPVILSIDSLYPIVLSQKAWDKFYYRVKKFKTRVVFVDPLTEEESEISSFDELKWTGKTDVSTITIEDEKDLQFPHYFSTGDGDYVQLSLGVSPGDGSSFGEGGNSEFSIGEAPPDAAKQYAAYQETAERLPGISYSGFGLDVKAACTAVFLMLGGDHNVPQIPGTIDLINYLFDPPLTYVPKQAAPVVGEQGISWSITGPLDDGMGTITDNSASIYQPRGSIGIAEDTLKITVEIVWKLDYEDPPLTYTPRDLKIRMTIEPKEYFTWGGRYNATTGDREAPL